MSDKKTFTIKVKGKGDNAGESSPSEPTPILTKRTSVDTPKREAPATPTQASPPASPAVDEIATVEEVKEINKQQLEDLEAQQKAEKAQILKEQDAQLKAQEQAIKDAKEREKEAAKLSLGAMANSATLSFLLKESSSLAAEKTHSIMELQAWHDKLLVFFAFQRAPYVQKLNNAQQRVANGENALIETKKHLLFLQRLHANSAKHLQGVSIFETGLHKTKDKKPVLPPCGESDPSVLALASMSLMAYTSHEKHLLLNTKLKIGLDCIALLMKNYGTQSQKEISAMQDQVKSCEYAASEVDKTFKQHMTSYNYYHSVLSSHTPAKEGAHPPAQLEAKDKKAFEKITSTSRKDMWKSEQLYREKVLGLTSTHKKFFSDCSVLLEKLHQAEQERALKLHGVINDVVININQYYAGMQLLSAALVNEVQLAVSQAVTNYQTQRDKQTADQIKMAKQSIPSRTPSSPSSSLASSSSTSSDNLTKPEPPGPFPTNTNVIIAGKVQRKVGFFKSWKDSYLVMSKDHYIHCFDYSHMDQSSEGAEMFGPGKGTQNATIDPTKIRFALKQTKSVDGASEFMADGYECTATYDKKDSDFVLNVVPSSFFSSNWSMRMRCPNQAERDMWVKYINENTHVTKQISDQMHTELTVNAAAAVGAAPPTPISPPSTNKSPSNKK